MEGAVEKKESGPNRRHTKNFLISEKLQQAHLVRLLKFLANPVDLSAHFNSLLIWPHSSS
jgi:hypothetical protein